MSVDVDAKSLQHCQPYIAQRCVILQDDVLPQFQIGPATCEDGWAVGQVVNRADIRAEGYGGVIKQT